MDRSKNEKQIDELLDSVLPDDSPNASSLKDKQQLHLKKKALSINKHRLLIQRNREETSFPSIRASWPVKRTAHASLARRGGKALTSRSMPSSPHPTTGNDQRNQFSPVQPSSPRPPSFSRTQTFRNHSISRDSSDIYNGKGSNNFIQDTPATQMEIRSMSRASESNIHVPDDISGQTQKLPSLVLRDTGFISKAFQKTANIRSSINQTDRLLNQRMKPKTAGGKSKGSDEPTEDEQRFFESLRTRKFYGEVAEATLRVDHFLRKLDLPTWAIDKQKDLHQTEEDEDADDPEMQNYLLAGVRFNQESENQEREAIMVKLKALSDKLGVNRSTQQLLSGVGRWLNDRQRAANTEMLLLFQAEQELATGIQEMKKSQIQMQTALRQRNSNIKHQAKKMMHHLKKRHNQHKEIIYEKEKEDAKKKETEQVERQGTIVDKDKLLQDLKLELNALEERIRSAKGANVSVNQPGTLAQKLQEHYEKKRAHLEHIIQTQKTKISTLHARILESEKENSELNEQFENQMTQHQKKLANAGGSLVSILEKKKQQVLNEHLRKKERLGEVQNELHELEKARQYREGLVQRNRKLRTQLADAEKKMGVNKPAHKERNNRLRTLNEEAEELGREVEYLESQNQTVAQDLAQERKQVQKLGMNNLTASSGSGEVVRVSDTEVSAAKQKSFALKHKLKALWKELEKVEDDLKLHMKDKEKATASGGAPVSFERGDSSSSLLMQKKVAEVGGVIFAFQRIGKQGAGGQIHELLVDYTPITQLISDVEDAVFDMTMTVAALAGIPSYEQMSSQAFEMQESATEKTNRIRSKLKAMEASINSFFEVMGSSGGADTSFDDVQRKFAVTKVAIRGASGISYVNAILVVLVQVAEMSEEAALYEGLNRSLVQLLTGPSKFTMEIAVKCLIGICDFIMEYSKMKHTRISADLIEDVQGLLVTKDEPTPEVIAQINQITAYHLLANLEEPKEIYALRTKLELYVESGRRISADFQHKAAEYLQMGRDRALKQDDFNDIALGFINTALQGVKELSKAAGLELHCFQNDASFLLSSLNHEEPNVLTTDDQQGEGSENDSDFTANDGDEEEGSDEEVQEDSDGKANDGTGRRGSTLTTKQKKKLEKKIEKLEKNTDRKVKSITKNTTVLSKLLSKAPQTIGTITDTEAINDFLGSKPASSVAYETYRLSMHKQNLQFLLQTIRAAINSPANHQDFDESTTTYDLASGMMKSMYELKVVAPDLDIKKLTEPPPPPPPTAKKKKKKKSDTKNSPAVMNEKTRWKQPKSHWPSSSSDDSESETETEDEKKQDHSEEEELDRFNGSYPRSDLATPPSSWAGRRQRTPNKQLRAEILASLGPTDQLLSLSQTEDSAVPDSPLLRSPKIKSPEKKPKDSSKTSTPKKKSKPKTQDQIIKEIRKQVRSKEKKVARLEKEWFKVRHRGQRKKHPGKKARTKKEDNEKILHTLETLFMTKAEKAEANKAIEDLKAEVSVVHHKLWNLRRKYDKMLRGNKKEDKTVRFPTTPLTTSDAPEPLHPVLKFVVEETMQKHKGNIPGLFSEGDGTVSPLKHPQGTISSCIKGGTKGFLSSSLHNHPFALSHQSKLPKDVQRRIIAKTGAITTLSSKLSSTNVIPGGLDNSKEGSDKATQIVGNISEKTTALHAAEAQKNIVQQLSEHLDHSSKTLNYNKDEHIASFDKALQTLHSSIQKSKSLKPSKALQAYVPPPIKTIQPLFGCTTAELQTIHEEDQNESVS